MSDWTNALVVRDRLGQLRHAGGFLDGPITAGLDPLEIAVFADTFGPLVPILGRTGLPIVTTVGDLTARHVGKRVRLDEYYDAKLETIFAHDGGKVSLNFTHPDGFTYGCSRYLDTPCEVLG